MAPVRPMLDDLELQQVQQIEVDGDQVLEQHAIPGLEGDFFQGLGRRATQVTLTGVLTDNPTTDAVGESLKVLRDKFRAAQPVSFVADIATATRVDEVLIEEMGVREIAGHPARFEYAFTLREYIEGIDPGRERPPPPPPPPPVETETGTLVVKVIVEGQPGFDHTETIVRVNGPQENGTPLSRTLTERANNVWTAEEFPAGSYTAIATIAGPIPLVGTDDGTVQSGQTTRLTIRLRVGQLVAKAFAIHYWFDKAFIEPCLRPVMRQIEAYAHAHPQEKLLIVGHTDLVGGDGYNQSLSERRGRGAYAYLTYGNHKEEAIREWDELRKSRPAGQLPSIHDTWGTREVQYLLQDLGYYIGNIDEDHGPATDAAIRAFQADKGLTVDGILGDESWAKLVDAYMAQDALAINVTQFFENCPNEIVKWIGCGEQDPVKNTQDAWRPNRRTEFLFVAASQIPCDLPRPDTFAFPEPGFVGTDWCLGPGNSDNRCCFTTRVPDETDRWLVEPVEPEKTLVQGQITFDDGTPVPNAKYTLIAPDGEYLYTDANGQPDLGERPSGSLRGRPIPNRADAEGKFSYPIPTPVGSYILELPDLVQPQVARLEEEPAYAARGNVICLRLNEVSERLANADRDASDLLEKILGIIQRVFTPAPPVNPQVMLASPVVLVKKPHTNPARQQVTLRTDAPFNRTGTLTRSGNTAAVRLFTAATNGTEITFNGTDNVFTGAQLHSGVTLFAEAGPTASGMMNDYQLSLTLAAGASPPVGPAVTVMMTAVALTVDLFMARTTAGVDPAPMPQPPAAPPAPGSNPTDKWFGGRFLHVQVPDGHQGRALIIIRQAAPADFNGDLVLRRVAVSGNSISGLNPRLRLFSSERPTVGDPNRGNPHEFNASTVPPAGLRFFVEGGAVSGALRDSAIQLGLKDVEADGDRVRLTVIRFSHLEAMIPSTPANTARLGNSPVPTHRHQLATGAAPAAANFDEDFGTNDPLVLLENSVQAATPINLSVRVTPAGVPIQWGVQRDTRPAPDGDHADIIALSPNPAPTVTPNAADPLRATMLTDAVGSFHVRPFVDTNGTGQFDHNIDLEPFIIMNLVLVQARLHRDNSIARNANFTGAARVGGGIDVSSGTFTIGAPATTAMHLNAQINLIGGSNDGQRGLNRVFAGWNNNESANENIVGTFRDASVAPSVNRISRSVFASNGGAATGAAGIVEVFLPGDPAPVPVAPALLDSGRGSPGTGGDTTTLNTSRIRTRTNLALGQRILVEAVDSPGDGDGANHPGFASAQLVQFQFGLTFTAYLSLWTNLSSSSGATGDPADRLYTVVRELDWSMNGRWSITPATGAVAVVTAPTVSITRRLTHNPQAMAANTNAETRSPTGLSLLARDARA